MIGLLTLLTVTASLLHHTLSFPGLIHKDLHPPTRTNTQDISEGAQGYLLSVPGGLNSRRLLWFWGNDEEQNDAPMSTTGAPYNDGVTTTKRPSRWSRWKSKVGNTFKELGTDIKEAANATKWAMKKAGGKVKDGFKKGWRKVKMKFRSADDKLNHFANRLKAQAEKGNQKAIRLLQKLGIIAHVEDGKVIRVDVEDEIDSVENILREEGVLKVISTTKLMTVTPHYIVTNDITQSVPSTDNVNSNILFTSTSMSNLRSTNLPNFSTTAQTTTMEQPWYTTEVAKTTTEAPKTTSEKLKTTAQTTTTELHEPISETAKTTTEIPKTTTKTRKTTMKISTAQTTTAEPPKTTSEAAKTTTETAKTTTENVMTTIKISAAKTTTTEQPEPTSEIVKTTTETPKTTAESPKTTIKISILESGDYDKDSPVDDKDKPFDSSSMDKDKDEEVYTPPPFPDVFGDNRVKNRLMELYEKGDFTHSELADLFDPDYYEYYDDYE